MGNDPFRRARGIVERGFVAGHTVESRQRVDRPAVLARVNVLVDPRQLGLPRIDQHIYARENGWAINALATFYGVTGDKSALNDATRAAEWIVAHRSLGKGGFSHDEKDTAGPYFGDNVYMARAFLMLYQVTADRKWLQRAQETVQFAADHFQGAAGYVAFAHSLGEKLAPKPQTDENS